MKDKVPMRKCVGCMESKEKHELVRIAYYEGKLTADFTGRAKGRGAYVCRGNMDCLEKAYKRRALERAFRAEIDPEDKARVFEELRGGQNEQ